MTFIRWELQLYEVDSNGPKFSSLVGLFSVQILEVRSYSWTPWWLASSMENRVSVQCAIDLKSVWVRDFQLGWDNS